ncbi:mitochondrial cardiolipin hydrolase [Octodon degus]|uniref:Mitochondrial cardiolipin hydrolase n=1 Tax=Octodon degus TaxID=10160 RepID=A0A6P3F7C5_OCTDE|nr:mitochondrial cardiolipin hydrolase [Octodon degus]
MGHYVGVGVQLRPPDPSLILSSCSLGTTQVCPETPGNSTHLEPGKPDMSENGGLAFHGQSGMGGRHRPGGGTGVGPVGGGPEAVAQSTWFTWALRAWPGTWWAGQVQGRVRRLNLYPEGLAFCGKTMRRLSWRMVASAVVGLTVALEAVPWLLAWLQVGRQRRPRLLHQRGVRVRVITDCDYMALNGSQIGLLRKAGIQVRHDQDLGYMHHKFAIVDKKVLITGSLNWTTQAIQNNRENVLIMEDSEYVRLFLEEFERIWEEFNPAKYSFFPQKKQIC